MPQTKVMLRYRGQSLRNWKGCIMKTNRRWLQSVILAASAEDAPALPWAALARPAALRPSVAE